MNVSCFPHSFSRLLLVTVATGLFGVASSIASTGPLAGSYSGTYKGKGNDGTEVTGPTDVKFVAKSEGTAGTMTLKGTASDGTKFTAKVVFNADGTCTTTALVPGVIPVQGTGTWTANANGTKISYTLAGTVDVLIFSTTVTTTGTIKKAGKKFKIKGKATANPPIPFTQVPSSGSYTYTGK